MTLTETLDVVPATCDTPCDTDLPADEKRRRARELWRQDPTITGVELSRRFGCEASWGRKQIAAARQQHAGQDAATQPARVPAIDNGPDDEPGTRDTPDVPRPAPPARHWIDTGTVLLVALVAAAASYGHMLEVALHAGEPVWLARAFPVTVDGLALAALRRGPTGRRWLALALVVSVAGNVLAQFPDAAAAAGPVVSAWPPLALYGTHRLLQREEA